MIKSIFLNQFDIYLFFTILILIKDYLHLNFVIMDEMVGRSGYAILKLLQQGCLIQACYLIHNFHMYGGA